MEAYHFAVGELADPKADSIFTAAALGYAAIYDHIKAAVNRRLAKLPPSQWADEISLIVNGYEALLGRTFTDTIVASFLAGADGLASKLPPKTFGSARIPPPDEPLLPGDPNEPDPLIEFPIIDIASRNLYERKILKRPVYDTLSSTARQTAFTVARLKSQQAVRRVRDAVAETINKGLTLRQFRAEIADVLDKTHLSPSHVETVLRNNIQTATASGEDAVANHPAVTDLFPYEEQVVIEDSRLTDLCFAISRGGIQGTAIYRRDDPVIIHFKRPRHHRCRCGRNFISVKQAAQKGIKEAQRWLGSGRPPATPAYVAWPRDVQLPVGWR